MGSPGLIVPGWGKVPRFSQTAPAKSRNDPSDYAAEIGPKGFREIRTGQRHLDRGLQEPQLVPGVEAAPGEAHGVDGSPFAQAFERVGDLDLSPVVGRG